MIRKLADLVVCKDPYYYLAFPACATLDDGRVLLTCRRALDPRFLLAGEGAPDHLTGAWSHLEPRSHNAMVLLGADLQPIAEPRAVPMNPIAADQDGSLLKLAGGRIVLSGFSWHPLPPPFAAAASAPGRLLRSDPTDRGLCWLFWGGFTRYTDDGGETWSEHNYLPPLPGMPDIVPGKRPWHGGATRGRAGEADGELLLGVYCPPPGGQTNAVFIYASADGNVLVVYYIYGQGGARHIAASVLEVTT